MSSGSQTDSGQTEGLNPLWPPSNKADHPDKIGYPHLRLPLAINTLIKKRVAEAGSPRKEGEASTIELIRTDASPAKHGYCVKSEAHKSYNDTHQDDWVPRIWDYNYLLFHLNRRDHTCDGETELNSCHASHMNGGLIG